MSGEPGSDLSVESNGREAWIKLILLSIALVLVAVSAFIHTDFGQAVIGVADSLTADIYPLAALLCALLALVGGYAFLLRKRTKPRIAFQRLGQTVAPAARDRLTAALSAQLAAHAKSGRQLALHVIDIDRFSAVNGMLGEIEGDAFLKTVAERLTALVDQPERLARIGDDEFAVLQPEVGGARHAELFARRINETVREAAGRLPRHARPDVSIGMAVSPGHGADPASLLRSASLALRGAKQKGGGAIQLYTRDMDAGLTERLQMEKAIGQGLSQGWFELCFQPRYDLRTRRLAGFEALVRMNHPERGQLLPAAFLPIAEESGLMQPLGEWITREAISAAADWPAALTLSLNISTAQLKKGDAAGGILQALSRTGLEGTRLRVEISEAAFRNEAVAERDQLQRLRSRGVAIVLDDFGSGGCSLEAISKGPCDAVKIDRLFVQPIGEDPAAENLVRGLIQAARALDLAVCAEGVERAEQAAFLMSNGCPDVQGFLLGRPVAAREIAAIVAKDLRNSAAMADAMQSGPAIAAA